MENSLLSVGLDVGTTTTQLILSRLEITNRAGGFAVPEMEITNRQILYRSPVRFTPMESENRVDAHAISQLVLQDYALAGISKEQVDTGAIIITGETSRKENAAAVLQALSGFAGEFVAATAGPHLESVLAAQGAGAVALSETCEMPVLHMDIGGGTANLALVKNGQILKTGCLNVGGRLVRLENGEITYVSPVLAGLTELKKGDRPTPTHLQAVAYILAEALEMAAGLRPVTALLEKLSTKEAGAVWMPPGEPCLISFSGGVADCIGGGTPGQYGDLGVELGMAIKNSLLCRGAYRLGAETIRATVIGAGCHSARLSGSTVFVGEVSLPVKNLPVAVFSGEEPDLPQVIGQQLRQLDTNRAVLAFPGRKGASYREITALAEKLAASALPEFIICLENDMAKALGQKLRLLCPEVPCLCIDRVRLKAGDYLDIGTPLGPALPVIVKTLILGQ